MFEEEKSRKSVSSLISFVSGLLSCACAPLCVLAAFMWLVAGYNVGGGNSIGADVFYRLMMYTPFIGMGLSLLAILTFVIGTIRKEDVKWTRIAGLVLGVIVSPVHALGILIFVNVFIATPMV